MSLWIPALAGRDSVYLRIADPIFSIRALGISFALVLSRAMNSRIIVLIQSMIPDILSRLVVVNILAEIAYILGISTETEHAKRFFCLTPSGRGTGRIQIRFYGEI
jgi:hypothetical protein